jgi:hypothetical protein
VLILRLHFGDVVEKIFKNSLLGITSFFFLCLLFIGFPSLVFAVHPNTCEELSASLAANTTGGITRILVEGSLTLEAASDACNSSTNASCSTCNDYDCWSVGYSCDSGTCQDFWSTCSYSSTPCADQAAGACGDIDNVVWDNVDTCEYHCSTGTPNPDWPSSCDEDHATCSQECGAGVNYVVSCSEDASGNVTGYNCVCDPDLPPPVDPEDSPKTCADLKKNCNLACNFLCLTGDDGYATNYKCDCSNNPDPDPTDDPDPSDDPSDPDDGNGWLAAIKSNTDTMVDGQGETNDWLKSIKKNADDQLDLDTDRNAALSKNNELLSDVITAINGIDDINVNIKQSEGEGTADLGTLEGEVGTGAGTEGQFTLEASEESDYGGQPTDTDLPSAESVNTSFGTFDPGETPSYVDAAESALDSLRPSLTSPVCTFDIDFEYHSGLIDIDFHQTWNLCEYESYFNLIGSVLVALAGLWNIYAFVFK